MDSINKLCHVCLVSFNRLFLDLLFRYIREYDPYLIPIKWGITAITRNHMDGGLHSPFCSLQKLHIWKVGNNMTFENL